MIACITPNPALDRTIGVACLEPGKVAARATWEQEAAGGKGVNVARMLDQLGRRAAVCGPLGGHTGDRIAALAAGDGIVAQWVSIAGESRVCDVIVEDSGRSTVVNGVGPLLSDSEWSAFLAAVRSVVAGAEMSTISGSMPGGEAHRVAALVEVAAAGGAPVWVDVAGARPDALVGASIKVNRSEASAWVGGADAVDVAGRLLAASGALAVVVTDGGAGAAYADHDEVWWCDAPQVRVANATGSGDAFFAGLVDALAAGASARSALRAAVTTGAAAATQPTATLDLAVLDRLLAVAPEPTAAIDRTGGGHG